ncbi:lipopolysaccharide biosynthesis protein, partial [Neobacillus drentensis]|uniref:lipopolysaccharide biosynthesis protein n=1 Tax=Neobacillus drentensis TaxID=220684 RepID=UPI003002DD67
MKDLFLKKPKKGTNDKSNSDKTKGSKKQLGLNILGSLINLVFGVLSGIVLTPFLIGKMGVSAFGIIALVNNIILYFGILTLIVNSASSRFVTIEIAHKNFERAQRIFSTTFWSLLIINIVILIIGIIGAFNLEKLISIPEGYELDTKIIFVCAVFSWCLTAISSPWGISLFSANRLDLLGLINSTQRVVYFIFSIILISFVSTRPYILAIPIFLGSLTIFILKFISWRKFLPNLNVNFSIDKEILRDTTSFGTWVSIDRLGMLFLTSVELILVNKLIGTKAGGEYASLLQWSILIKNLSIAVATSFGPSMAYLYADKKINELTSYTKRAIRLTSILVVLPSAAIFGFASPILLVWLGNDFVHLAPLFVLITIHLAVNMSLHPLSELQQTISKVKVPSIVTCFIGLVNILLSIYLVKNTGLGMYGVALAGAATYFIKNVIFNTIYSANILNIKWYGFLNEIVRTIVFLTIMSCVAFVVNQYSNIDSLQKLMVSGFIFLVLYLIFTWFFMVSN